MKSLRLHFQALLKKINPPPERRKLAKDLVGDLRGWLQEHDFETIPPHTRLIGSYARSTAVLWIRDVDVLVFLPETARDRTPHAVLLELRRVLADYPGAVVSAVGQRRSIRLELVEHDFVLHVVPAVAPDGLDAPLEVPDRPKEKWIDSEPLGYMERLSDLNKAHGKKVVPFVKLVKAWRDENFAIRRPKSYMLEVMVVNAIEAEVVAVAGESWPSILAQLFAHWKDKYHELMERDEGVPRIYDPQLGHLISGSWERAEFETFMRRVREADRAAQRALAADTEEDAAEEWKRVFGDCWPSEDEVDEQARVEAAGIGPGVSRIAASGWVTGPSIARTIATHPTRYHGDDR